MRRFLPHCLLLLGAACNTDSAPTQGGETDDPLDSTSTTASPTTADTHSTTDDAETTRTAGSTSGGDETSTTSDTTDESSAEGSSGTDTSGTTGDDPTDTTGEMLVPCSERSWGTPVSLQAIANNVTNTAPFLLVDDAGNVTALWGQHYPGGGNPDSGPQFNRYEPANGGWQGAEPIDPAEPWQTIHGAVVDGLGDVTVVVSDVSGIFDQKLAYRFDVVLGTWSGAEPISNLVGPSFRAGPAVDAFGNVFVVLQDTLGALRVARYDRVGDAWTLDTTVSAPGHTVDINGAPDLAVDPAGHAFVVYGAISGVPHTWAVRYDVGTNSWSTAHDLGGSAQIPLVAAQTNGTALAVWRQVLPSDNVYHYRASFYDPGPNTWSSPTWVEQHTGSTMGAVLLPDDADGFWISYRRSGEFYTNRYEPGVGFDTAAQHTIFGNAASTERLLLVPGGDAWTFWGEYEGGIGNVIGRHFDGVQGWGQPAIVDDNDDDNAGLRRVVVDHEGTPTVVWRHAAGSTGNLRASCYDAQLDGWSDAQDVETSFQLSSQTAAVVDGSGIVTVIWYQYAANLMTIWANRFE